MKRLLMMKRVIWGEITHKHEACLGEGGISKTTCQCAISCDVVD